jgi:hypothetical protein
MTVSDKMTVSDLIKLLENYPQDAEVKSGFMLGAPQPQVSDGIVYI